MTTELILNYESDEGTETRTGFSVVLAEDVTLGELTDAFCRGVISLGYSINRDIMIDVINEYDSKKDLSYFPGAKLDV